MATFCARGIRARRRKPLRFIAAPVICLLALLITLPGRVLAADPACPQHADGGGIAATNELNEIVIVGDAVRTGTRDLQAWLRRLVGRFTYDGYVDLCGNGKASDLRAITGNADCVGAGSTPHVFCTVHLRWAETDELGAGTGPGDISRQRPAFVVFSLENGFVSDRKRHRPGLMFTQVDNQGVAEWASGTLAGDTFTALEPCVGTPRKCEKLTRITARSGSNEISMQVEIRIDDRQVLRQSFLLHRASGVTPAAPRTGSPP